jgi:hypothetical protein
MRTSAKNTYKIVFTCINIKHTILVSILYSCLCSISCKKINEYRDAKLILKKQNYTGNELRINGYYYNTYSYNGSTNYNIYFFYRNGIKLYGTSVNVADLPAMEQQYMDGTYANNSRMYKSDWGVFQIEGSTLLSESWSASDGRLPAYRSEAQIINDSTFQVIKRWEIKRCKLKNLEDFSSNPEIYHFKQLAIKPDSINSFVK